MKTPFRHLALLILLALAFAGAPGHAATMAAMGQMTDCGTHGAHAKDCDCKAHTAMRCAADCVATPFSSEAAATHWRPNAPRVLAIADQPHSGWHLRPQTPPPRLPA